MPNSGSFTGVFDKECDYCGRKFRESKLHCPHCNKVNIDALLKNNNMVFTARMANRPGSSEVVEEVLRYDDDL